MKCQLLLVLALLFPQSGAAAAGQPPPGVTKTASVEGIEEYSLSNGLKVLLFPDHSKPTITVNIVYQVGSRQENYGETGLAHILEHLLLKGSRRYPELKKELFARGAAYNAETLYDRTNYFETLPASDESLEFALDLEADRMVNAFLHAKDLASEKTVIKNEFEMIENRPQRILWERVMSTAFLWHNYGKAEIGAVTDILNVPHERLLAFYRNWYQPDNAVLVVAGAFDTAKALSLVKKKFGGIPKPARALRKTYTLEPVQDGERLVTLRRAGDTQFVTAGYHTPPYPHADTPAMDVLAAILGDAASGRLYKTLVETGKAASLQAQNLAMREGGMATFSAGVRGGKPLEEARDGLLAALEQAAAGDFTEEETEKARTALLKKAERAMNSPQRMAMVLTEPIAYGDWRLFFINRDRLKEVKPADVKRVAARYLKSSNRTLGLFYPEEKSDRSVIPPPEDVSALAKEYKGGKAVEAGEAFEASPENIERRTVRATLKNGLKLALLPKRTRGGSVTVSIALRRGSPETLKGKAAISDLLRNMFMRGTARRGREKISQEFDRLKTLARITGGAYLETDRPNLEGALRLAAEVMREPAFEEKEFETLRQETLSRLEEQKKQPDALAWKAYDRHVLPYPAEDIRYTPTFDEKIAKIKAVTLEEVKEYYRDFYGASFGEFTAIGDFDPEELKALAGELFGDWVTPQPYGRLAKVYAEVPPARYTIETPDKANAITLIGLTLPLREDHPDAPALLLANYIAGGHLSSRFSARIRETEGLSYSVWSEMASDPEDPFTFFTASAISGPENAARTEKAFREEINRIIAEGFSGEELAKAKNGWLQARKVARAADGSLAGLLNTNEYLGRTMAWHAALEKKVKELTPAQVQDAFKRHIRPDRLIVVQAGDFGGIAAPQKK